MEMEHLHVSAPVLDFIYKTWSFKGFRRLEFMRYLVLCHNFEAEKLTKWEKPRKTIEIDLNEARRHLKEWDFSINGV